MELARRKVNTFAHTAVAHHAERLVLFAAVGEAAAARVTPLAVDIRLHRAAVTGPDIRHALTDREHFDAELVPRNARVGVERHFAEIPAVIGTANPDAMHTHERLTGRECGGLGQIEWTKSERFFEEDGFHRNIWRATRSDGGAAR